VNVGENNDLEVLVEEIWLRMRAGQKSLPPPQDYRRQFIPVKGETKGGGENEMRGKVDNSGILSFFKMPMERMYRDDRLC
jgi:hypothetical protein